MQLQFAQTLFDNKSPLDFVASENSRERLAIYRNTIYANLKRTLKIIYPGIWSLIGDNCADQLAMMYCSDQANCPNSGCLDDWGKDFPDFIKTVEALQTLPYLSDYAEYEWNKQLAYLGVPTDQEILLHSKYPLQKIEYLIENPDSANVDLG